jgi:hypothetical protein
MNRSLNIQLLPFLKSASLKRGAIFGSILIGALLSFEVFNFGTTSFALGDILGDLTFAGIKWSTMLAFAFCGIDFAGIARIFTPEQGRDEPKEVWYLFGAWLLAAGFNASLTWWGVSVAIVSHSSAAAGAVVSSATLTKVIPIFVAVMIWLIRVLIIGTFSLAGDRLFSTASETASRPYQPSTPLPSSSFRPASSLGRPAPKPAGQTSFSSAKPEPTYHSLGFDSNPRQREQ